MASTLLSRVMGGAPPPKEAVAKGARASDLQFYLSNLQEPRRIARSAILPEPAEKHDLAAREAHGGVPS